MLLGNSSEIPFSLSIFSVLYKDIYQSIYIFYIFTASFVIFYIMLSLMCIFRLNFIRSKHLENNKDYLLKKKFPLLKPVSYEVILEL